MLRVEEGGKGDGFGRELSVGAMEGLKVVVRGLLVEEDELGGGGDGVRLWSLGALKLNVAACKCNTKRSKIFHVITIIYTPLPLVRKSATALLLLPA